MSFESIGSLMGVFATTAGILGWVFKVWIINPLNLSIVALDRSLIKMDAAIDKMREQSIGLQTDIARIDASVKSAHNRLDDFAERVYSMEKEMRGHD